MPSQNGKVLSAVECLNYALGDRQAIIDRRTEVVESGSKGGGCLTSKGELQVLLSVRTSFKHSPFNGECTRRFNKLRHNDAGAVLFYFLLQEYKDNARSSQSILPRGEPQLDPISQHGVFQAKNEIGRQTMIKLQRRSSPAGFSTET